MPLPAFEDVIRYLLNYQREYDLQHAARLAAWERQGMTLITHHSYELAEDDNDADGRERGIVITNAVTGEELWRGNRDEWPHNDAWVHTVNVGWDSFEATPRPVYKGVPDSLMQAMERWCDSNTEEAKKFVRG
jgi:hypothetical protein